jgi:phosphatidylserine decarboxylase
MAQASHDPKTRQKAHRRSRLLTLEEAGPVQMGFWMPNRVWATAKYIRPLRNHIATKRAAGTLTPMRPELTELKHWVSENPVYRMWVCLMIEQANAFVTTLDDTTLEQIEDKDGDALWIKNFDNLFEILNEIVTTSPAFNETFMVGTPMNGLLCVAMGTQAGVALFHDSAFNAQFKPVLNAWNEFLKSADSLDKLDIREPEKPGSWISAAAKRAGVWDQFECDPTAPGYGFDSWNSFFIRKFLPGARPFLGDPKTDIDIGCETTPWQYEHNVALITDFWIKDCNYSLLDIFAGQREWARLFEGGEAYQGFLAATHYHRWHAPLEGHIVRSWVQPGTYAAQRPAQGEEPGAWEGTELQPYLPHVAARAIFIFKHELCGYVALVCVGMVEVSTCFIEPEYVVDEGIEPVPVSRGADIGHFEFGGSTHMLIFQRGRVNLVDWAVHAKKHRTDLRPVPLGTVIATATER